MDTQTEQEAKIRESLKNPKEPVYFFARAVNTLTNKGFSRDELVSLLDILLRVLPTLPEEDKP